MRSCIAAVVLNIAVTWPALADPPAAPVGVAATIVAPTQVAVIWDAAGGADSYEIRRNGSSIGTAGTNSFTDNGAAAGAVQLYTVRAIGPGGASAWSGAALAQTTAFDDVTLVPRLTAIRATHVLQLRDAVNALRAAALLPPATFTDASLGGPPVRATHVNELRSSLDGARATLGLVPLSYTNTLVPQTTPVRAADLNELRAGVTGRGPEGLFWNSVAVPSAVQAMACSASSVFVGTPGSIRRSADGGTTWSNSAGLPGGANVTAIVAAGGGYVFAHAAPDRMERSTDDGANFNQVATTPAAFTSLTGAPNGLFAIGGACASVWFSADGASWTARNSGISGCVTSLARSSRGRLYAGTAADGVFVSANDGASWTPAGAGIPSTNIHAITTDRDQRVFVATHGQGVYRSSDGGGSFTTAGSGVSDLASLLTDSTGVLVGGSESGARIQISADDGSAWTASSAGLPSTGSTAALCSTHRHRFAAIDGKLFRAPVEYRLDGLNFSPFVDGQNFDSPVTVAQLLERMQIVRPSTRTIRTFRVSNGLQHIARIARTLGLKTAIGAAITSDLQQNESELAALIAIGRAGDADVLVVGNEVLLKNYVSPAALIAYIQCVQAAVPGVPVTTVETFDRLLANPSVIAAVDVVYANYYPFWSAGGIPIDDAIAFIDSKNQEVRAVAAGKTVVVSEAGWPGADDFGTRPLATAANAAQHFREFAAWARATGTGYLYFSSFDEEWKTNEEGVGKHWGVWTRSGALKPLNEPVLAGEWGGDEVLSGPGTPSLALTSVPPYGSFGILRGQVQHVVPNDHRVAVYIRVGSQWWMKPYSLQPLTWIRGNGTWGCDVATHVNDLNATELTAYLLPAWYTPPQVLGLSTIPAEIGANALASAHVTRSP